MSIQLVLVTAFFSIIFLILLRYLLKYRQKQTEIHHLNQTLMKWQAVVVEGQDSPSAIWVDRDGKILISDNNALEYFSKWSDKTVVQDVSKFGLQDFGQLKLVFENIDDVQPFRRHWIFTPNIIEQSDLLDESHSFFLISEQVDKIGTRWLLYEEMPDHFHMQEVDASPSKEDTHFAQISDFLDFVPIGIFTCDQESRIHYMNHSASAILGALDETKKFPKHIVEAKDHARLEAFCNIVKEHYKDTYEDAVEVKFTTQPKDIFKLRVLSHYTQTKGQGVTLLMIENITERKKLEQQFVQSQKMQAIGQLAGGVAHDFNNMLTAMIGFCDLLLLRHQPGDPSFVDTMQIKQNANRAAGLVRQLLAFSRMDQVDAKPLNLVDILSELTSLLNRLLGDNVELELNHGRDLGHIRFDQVQFEQMIINLALNARDAMKGGGRLVIRTEKFIAKKEYRIRDAFMPAGNYVSISITDTGIGISKENIERIFDPFYTTKDVGEGTGLGLSMVIGAVQQAEGYIFVHSGGEGKGTTFIIYLPEAEVNQNEDVDVLRDDNDEKDVTGVEHILLVEDEDAVRSFAARALRSKGYMVTEARAGDIAIDLLNNGDAASEFDLLITDLMMPRVSGADVIKVARQKYETIPIICISGYAKESVAENLDDFSSLYFLPKPFSLKQLALKVKQALDSLNQGQNEFAQLPTGKD